MNYFDPYSSYPDHTITAAWDSQLKESAQPSWLKELLLQRGSELFPSFAACYTELRALPRGARRALQHRIARSSELAAIFPEWLQSGGGRALQHKLARSLAGAALLLALAQGVATAATITVTPKVAPGIVADGQCSLIEAIVNANNDAMTHADCAAGSGADMIVLPAKANVRLRDVNDNTYGPTGLPLITSPITIQGNGVRIRRQGGAPDFRLMAVSNSGDLTLQNVTLSGGYSPYRGGGNHGFGGGALNHGSLTIESSTISGNTAEFGGGVANFGTLTIENSTITQNTASSGIFGGGGGGVLNAFGGVATIQDSTISNNSAPNHHGGGVYNHTGTLSIQNSTISGNSANVGGGVYNSAVGYSISSVTITNSTISNNSASRGGGASNCPCSFYPYTYAILTLNRSLIAGNQAATGPEIENFGTVNADNSNLFGANGNAGVTGFPPGVTDIVPAPGVRVRNILGPLRNNGGPTKTHALKPGSPALDVVPPVDPGCVGTDQRGVDRPQGTGCDIGAFELGP